MFGLKKLFTKTNGQSSGNLTQIATLEEFSNILRLTEDYGSLAKKGYIENCIVNICIRRTCEAMNSIPIKFMQNGKEVDISTGDKLTKSIIQAFNDPNPDYDKDLFIESVQSQIYINGETYVYVPEDVLGNISGFKYLRPDKVSPTQSQNDSVHSYQYTSGSDIMTFTRESTIDNGERIENVDSLQGRFNLVIYKTYNPISEINSSSRLKSCALSIDGHNQALKHNNSVMKNAGKVSGILTFGNDAGAGSMRPEQIDDLYKKLTQRTTGSNKGSILVANNSAKFEKFSLTPQEMDFLNGLVQRAIDICNSLDYPPYLLGFTGATYANQAEAKLSLFENSAIPKMDRLYKNITTYLNRKYDIDFKVELDLLKVPAMAPRFKEQNDNILSQWEKNVINHNEVRDKLQYEEAADDTGDLYFADFSRNAPQNEPPA